MSEALKTTFADSAVQESLKKALSQGAEENASSSSDAGIPDTEKAVVAAASAEENAALVGKLQDTITSTGNAIVEGALAASGAGELAAAAKVGESILNATLDTAAAIKGNTATSDENLNKLNESLNSLGKNAKESTEKTAQASTEWKSDETSKIDQTVSESAEENNEVTVETAKEKEAIDGLVIAGFADQMKVGNVKLEDWFEETENFVNKVLEDNAIAKGDVDQSVVDALDKLAEEVSSTLKDIGGNESAEAPAASEEGEASIASEEAAGAEGGEAEGKGEEEEKTLGKTRNSSDATAESNVVPLEREVKSSAAAPKSAASTIEGLEKDKKVSSAQKDGEVSPIPKAKNGIGQKEAKSEIHKEQLKMPKGSDDPKRYSVVLNILGGLMKILTSIFDCIKNIFSGVKESTNVAKAEAKDKKSSSQFKKASTVAQAKAAAKSGGGIGSAIGKSLKNLPGALAGAMSKAKLGMIIQIVSIIAFLGYSIYKMFKNPELMKKIGNLIKTGAIKLFGFIKDFLNKASGIAIVVAGVVAAIAMMWIFGPYGLLVAGIATIMALMYRYREKIADFIIKMGQYLSKAWHNIMVKLKAVPDKFKEAMSNIWEKIKGFFSSAADKVKNFFLDFLSKIPIIGKYFKKQAQDEAADEAVKKAEADSMKAKAEEEQKSIGEKMDEEHLKAVQTPAVREPEPKAQTRTPEAESKTTYRQPANIERQASVKTDAPKTTTRHDRLERRNDRRSATVEERRSNVKETRAREDKRLEKETRSDVARVERRSNVKETNTREDKRIEKETRTDVAVAERRTDTSAEEKKVQKLSAEELKTKMITALLSKQVNFQKAGFVKQNVISKLLIAIAEMVKKLVELKSRDDPAKTAIELAKMAKAKAKETYNAAKDKVKSFFGFKKKEEPKAEQPTASEVTVNTAAPEAAKEAEIKAETKEAGVTPIVNPDSIASYVNKVDESNASSTTNIDASKSVASSTGIETTVTTDSSSIVTNAAVVNENVENMKREAAISAAQSAESASELENEEESTGPDYTKLVNALPLAIAQGLATYFTNRHIKLTTDDGEDALEVEADDSPTAI